MSVTELFDIGQLIKDNTYVGRGIVIGKSEDGESLAVAYFIMGRSGNSRNRVFIESGDDVIIHPFDASKVEDPSLIIYSPIRKLDNKLIVTNGDQTDTIYDYVAVGKSFSDALKTRCFEPDGPNFTPRVSGMVTFNDNDFTYEMSILKAADEAATACNRFTFDYAAIDGTGRFIHTYKHDGNPIPTFDGEPERVKIPNTAEELATNLWGNLNAENKVSLYVRYINLKTNKKTNILINRNK